MYFQLVDNNVEVSWNNEGAEDGVKLLNIIGGAKIERNVFYSVIDAFLKEYADQWFL